jgi:hypothetical protein
VTGETFASTPSFWHDVDDITIENVPGLPPFIRVGDIVPDDARGVHVLGHQDRPERRRRRRLDAAS